MSDKNITYTSFLLVVNKYNKNIRGKVMEGELIKTTLLGLFFGTFGTTLGGVLGIIIKKDSNKFLSFILSFASGLMMAIICFDLIPEALGLCNISNMVLGIGFGIIVMIVCDILVKKRFGENEKEHQIKRESLLKTGIIVSIGLAIHNFPEGLAIGSGFEASAKLGIGLALAICLHDIPEGISMAVPLKRGGMKSLKILFYVICSGITTGIGAFFGVIVGSIGAQIIAICLSFAAGAMLYIVSGELIPESNKLYKGRMTSIGNMIGFIIGILATIL